MGVRYQRAVDLVELTGILQTTVTGLSIDEISDRFEVSRRTAERMLSALRDRFPDLEPIFRSGRKYWKLPGTSRARPLQLPRTLEALSERIGELEADLTQTRDAAEESRAIADGVLGTSPVGVLVLDANFRVVWTNHSLCNYLGLDPASLISQDVRALVRDTIQNVFEDPARFSERMLASYDDNSYVENFECHVLPDGDREERWLEHWSRPIPTGRYAGGRIDHYIDITPRVRDGVRAVHKEQLAASSRPQAEVTTSPPETVAPILKQHLANMRDAAREALGGQDIPPALARRLEQVVESTNETIGCALTILEQGQTKAEPLSAATALRTVATLVEKTALEKGIQIAVEPGADLPSIIADRAMMISCLANTTRNSIAALPPGSLIELRADRLHDPDRVRISIRDDGPGMPDRFRDLDQPFLPTQKGGIGLGVVLVRDTEGKPTGGVAQYFEAPTHDEGQEEQCYWSTPSGLDE